MSPGGGYQMKRGLGFFLSLCRLPDTGGIYLFTKVDQDGTVLEPAHTDVKTPGPLYLKAEDEGNQTEEATKEGGGEDDKGLVAPKEVDDKVASEDKGGGTKDVVPSAVTNKGEEGKKAKKLRYPLQVGPILLMEACERYSYYGMMAVFSMFMRHVLEEDHKKSKIDAEDEATQISSVFKGMAYGFPIIGAMVSDALLGDFHVIMWIGILNAAGSGLQAVAALPRNEYGIIDNPRLELTWVAIFLNAVGTGAVKACVIPFGAKQFKMPEQEEHRRRYFAWFYGAINFGALLSMFISPQIRGHKCLGVENCYTWAFGVPAILMVLSCIFFGMGWPCYVMLQPKSDVFQRFFGTICYALRKKCSSDEKRESWVDYALEKYGARQVSDTKNVLKAIALFPFYILYWCLYGQNDSRWVFQASHMNSHMSGQWFWMPEQMQILNPLEILLFIPLFDFVIYPFFQKYGMLTTPLQKIITGGFIMVVAFLVALVLELVLQGHYPHPPGSKQARLAVYNSLPVRPGCAVNVELTVLNFKDVKLDNLVVEGKSSGQVKNGDGHELLPFEVAEGDAGAEIKAVGRLAGICYPDMDTTEIELKFRIPEKNSTTIFFYADYTRKNLMAYATKISDAVQQSSDNGVYIRPIYYLPYVSRVANETQIYISDLLHEDEVPFTFTSDAATADLKPKDKKGFLGKRYVCFREYPEAQSVCAGESGEGYDTIGPKEFNFKWGYTYNLYVTLGPYDYDYQYYELMVDVEVVSAGTEIHVFWQIPQYTLLTVSEVLTSITSYEFAFTCAPSDMKAIVQSLYLLQMAFGNVVTIVVIESITKTLFTDQAQEFLFFACLLTVNMVAFMLVAKYWYTYRDFEDSGHGKTEMKMKSMKGPGVSKTSSGEGKGSEEKREGAKALVKEARF